MNLTHTIILDNICSQIVIPLDYSWIIAFILGFVFFILIKIFLVLVFDDV